MRRSALILGLAIGCGSSSSTPTPTSDAQVADARPDAAPFVMTGTVIDQNANPIGNAQVCLLDHPEVACSTTDENGTWVLSIAFLPPPPSVEIATSASASAYLGFVGLDDETVPGGVGYYTTIPLFSDAQAATLLATNAGFTYPSTTTGFVRVRVHAPIGATAALSPVSGSGPIYTQTNGTPDPQLTATQATDTFVYFGNVAPGKYDVAVSAAGKTCYDRTQASGTTPILGDWPPTGSGAAGVELIAAAMTDGGNVYCF